MADLKAKRKVSANSKSEELTDELYEQLSLGQQILVAVAEHFKIEVMVGDYNGNKYVDRDTLQVIAAKIN